MRQKRAKYIHTPRFVTQYFQVYPQSDRSYTSSLSTPLWLPAVRGQDCFDSVDMRQPYYGDRRLFPLEGHEVCGHHLQRNGKVAFVRIVLLLSPWKPCRPVWSSEGPRWRYVRILRHDVMIYVRTYETRFHRVPQDMIHP